MKALKRILIITSEFPPQPGGIGNHAYHLAKYLTLEGCQVKVITDQRSISGETEATFDGLLQFQVQRVANRNLRLLMYVKRLQYVLKAMRSVEVVIASGKFSLWSVAFASLFYKRNYVAVIHGSEVNFKGALLKTSIDWSLNRFSKIIAVSNYTKSLIAHLKLRQVEVIPNGFEVSNWNPEGMASLPLEGSPKLITVGNVTERKGQSNVIKQLPELLQVFPQLHYHCIGIPTEKKRFLNLAKTLEVDGHVTFHGQVNDSRLQQLLVSCDVFVMLSSATASGDVEGFGIAILEANALGIPAIGALGCGIEDAIADYQSGRLIANDDSEAFIEALTDVLAHHECYEEGAKAWALQHDWRLIVKRYIEVID